MSTSPLPQTLLLPPSAFRAAHPHVKGLLATAVVFHPDSDAGPDQPPRVLLVRRAASNCWPLLWETPGGGVDDTDPSLAAAAVRELAEETGLRARRVLAAVVPRPEQLVPTTGASSNSKTKSTGPPGDWSIDPSCHLPVFTETGSLWARATIVADCGTAPPNVTLRPDEHAEAAWLTEDEVRAGVMGAEEAPLDMVSEGVRQTVLAAFRLRREAGGWRDVGDEAA
jgi:8-oxo-dGTP pyrophosphatase MutT (NUDIX family)